MNNKVINFLKNNTIRSSYILKLIWNKKDTYLYKTGWIRSFKERAPIDNNNNAQPWLSIPANKFLDERLSAGMTIFEYGAGNSSKYFSTNGLIVHSVEHNSAWYNALAQQKVQNQKIELLDLNTNYDSFINTLNTSFDIILIDGRKRVSCLKNSFDNLNSNGVIIFDDSDRDKYAIIFKLMEEANYKKIDFWGMALGSYREKCTTIFYRSNNCLNI